MEDLWRTTRVARWLTTGWLSIGLIAALAPWSVGQPASPSAAPLALRLQADVPIYKPGEALPFEVDLDPALLGFSGVAQIDVELTPAGLGPAAWSESRSATIAQATTLSFQPTTPVADGAYWVRVVATAPASFRTRLLPGGGARVLAEAKRQLLVMSSESSVRPTTAWLPGAEVDPTTHRWWERSPDWLRTRRLAWFSEGPLSMGALRPVVVEGRRFIEIPAGASGPAAAWQLIPLSVQEPGTAHLIEVAVPAGADQALTLSIVEPDASGRLGPIGASVTHAVAASAVGGDSGVARRLFWPRTSQPLLLLSNGRSDLPALYASVRVRRCGESPRDRGTADERPVMLDASQGSTAADLAAGDASTPDDWHAAYAAARALADLVELKGANTAIIQGHSSAVDPWQETTLREFDRRGLKVLVKIDSEPAAPQSEAENPLAAMDARIDRLLAGAARRRSFAGIAIDLVPGATVLAPPPWTPSESMLNQFLKQADLAWPASANRDEATVSAALTGPWREAWQEWRAGQVTQHYGAVRDRTTAAGRGLTVYLMADGLLRTPEALERLRPRLNSPVTAAGLLLEHGLDTRAIADIRGLELIVAERFGSTGPLEDNALALTSARFADLGGGRQLPVAAFERATLHVDLESFEQARGCPDCTLRSVVYTYGRHERMSMTRVTAERDAAGLIESSGVIDLSFDEPQRRTRQTVRRLPARGASEATTSQPVYVRTYAQAPGRLVIFANASPWPVRATTTLANQTGCDAVEVKPWDEVPAAASRLEQGQHAFEFDLAPFETRMLSVSDPDAKIVGLRTTTPPEAETLLRGIVDDMKRRDLNARRPFEGVIDPGFELATPGGVPSAWEATATPPSQVVAVTQSPLSGLRSLRLDSRGATASAASKPFAIPDSGQLVVQFGVRPIEIADDTRVVIAFDSLDGTYHSATSISAEVLRADAESSPWPAYVFGVDDLPLGQQAQMRVSITCTGTGTVDVDDLQFFSLFYPMQVFRDETKWQRLAFVRMVQSAEVALDDGRYTECLQIVDGYWPRFLREYAPHHQEPVASPPATAQRDPAEPPATAPTLGERLKGWTPGFWR